MFFYEYSCGHMCICASISACANIPLQPRRAPAAECPGAPAGTDLGWPAAARGWCRPNQWSPLSAPPAPQAGCTRSRVIRGTSSPAGTPRWTTGGGVGGVIGVEGRIVEKRKEKTEVATHKSFRNHCPERITIIYCLIIIMHLTSSSLNNKDYGI